MSYQPASLPVYDNRDRMIDWTRRVLEICPPSDEPRDNALHLVQRLEQQNPEELHRRARRAMRLMFEAGRSGNGRKAFYQGLLAAAS